MGDLRPPPDLFATLLHVSAGSIATVKKADESPAFVGTLTLHVVDGPTAGRSLVLDDAVPGRALLGRGPASALALDDPQISRRHAALEIVGNTVRILDMGSSNGIHVDGVRVFDAQLRGGERIVIGGTTLTVERAEAVPASRVAGGWRFGRVVGQSREMRRLYPLCTKLASAKVPVLIEGETGTGKEVLAEALHEEGPRKDGPFIVFDCTTVPANLMESELFGHERGAFTGASAAREGVLEQAHGGTLLIDEIGDLELSLQAKLLRAIEKLEFRRVGGSKTMRVDVLLLAATRRDLDREVQAGRFRDDLYHRLAVARIELPPLRRRKGDVPLLVAEICRQHGATSTDIDARTLEQWDKEEWPGNVRELRNAVQRRLELGAEADALVYRPRSQAPPRDSASVPALREVIASILSTDVPLVTARQRIMDEFDRQYVERVLHEHAGNVTRAAQASGIARRHFHRMIARMRGDDP